MLKLCMQVSCRQFSTRILVGQWLKEWRRRYFFLKGNQLHFAKGPSVCVVYLPLLSFLWMCALIWIFYLHQQHAPHGVVDLSKCLTVKSAEEKTNKRYFIFFHSTQRLVALPETFNLRQLDTVSRLRQKVRPSLCLLGQIKKRMNGLAPLGGFVINDILTKFRKIFMHPTSRFQSHRQVLERLRRSRAIRRWPLNFRHTCRMIWKFVVVG